MIRIKKVETKTELRKFIDFPHDLYKNDKNYVAPLYLSQKELLNKKTSLFLRHSLADYFLAFKDDQIVGRIAAIQNNNYINFANEQAGFFGFFDVIDDYEVAKALLDKAVEWIKDHKLPVMYGPMNFSTNETCGLLIDGFDSPPVVLMTYNSKYYIDLLEKYGFKKKMDLYAYWLKSENRPENLNRIAPIIEKRLETQGIIIRKINFGKVEEEIEKIKAVYNAAWQRNWGFVPMTDDEFQAIGNELKMIADPELVFVAEKDGKIIGVSVSIPDINQVLIKIKRGRLFPIGIFKFLLNRKKIDTLRILIMGVLEPYRLLGVDACFYSRSYLTALKKGYKYGEASWILETNLMMNKALLNINAEVYKTYRVYELPVHLKTE
jgi:hypothetical protein